MPQLEPKKNKPHYEAALQLRGFPAGTTALLPCPTKCVCANCALVAPAKGLVEAKCAACSAVVVCPELALTMSIVIACLPCMRAAVDDAKRLAAGGTQ